MNKIVQIYMNNNSVIDIYEDVIILNESYNKESSLDFIEWFVKQINRVDDNLFKIETNGSIFYINKLSISFISKIDNEPIFSFE